MCVKRGQGFVQKNPIGSLLLSLGQSSKIGTMRDGGTFEIIFLKTLYNHDSLVYFPCF